MKTFLPLALLFTLVSLARAQELPKPAEPTKEHLWLKQLAGEWTIASEATLEPGKPPLKCNGVESSKSFGEHWFVASITNEMPGVKVSAQMLLGYDAEKKKYVGTWFDTMHAYLWHYEGSVDATGKILTLEAEGPSMEGAGKKAKYRDVIELKSADQKTLTSFMQGPDGKWVQFMTSTYTRKK